MMYMMVFEVHMIDHSLWSYMIIGIIRWNILWLNVFLLTILCNCTNPYLYRKIVSITTNWTRPESKKKSLNSSRIQKLFSILNLETKKRLDLATQKLLSSVLDTRNAIESWGSELVYCEYQMSEPLSLQYTK